MKITTLQFFKTNLRSMLAVEVHQIGVAKHCLLFFQRYRVIMHFTRNCRHPSQMDMLCLKIAKLMRDRLMTK